MVCQGLDNREIAHSRNTSRSTAKNQMAAILHKLGARNRTHAAAIYAGRQSEARIYQDAEKHILRRLRRVGK